MSYSVTLVHGTFGSKTRWTREDSHLCQALTAGLGAPVVLRRFVWSGRNSSGDREAAAGRLRDFLRDAIEQTPVHRHVVISHSHGGTVALHAICGTELERQVDGIVCLATPFLHVYARDLGGVDGRIADYTVYGPFALGAVLALAPMLIESLRSGLSALGRGAPQAAPFATGSLADAGHVIAIVAAAAVAVGCVRAVLVPVLVTAAQRVLSANHWPDTVQANLKIVRVVGDEASGLLIAAQFSAWLLRRAADLVLWPERASTAALRAWITWAETVERSRWRVKRLVGWAMRRIGVVPYALAAVGILACYLIWVCFGPTAGGISMLVLVLASAVLLLPLMTLHSMPELLRLPIALCVVPLGVLSAVVLLPFGHDVALSALFLEVSAETTPPDAVNVSMNVLPPDPARVSALLRHSAVYEDDRVSLELVRWIRGLS